MVGFGVARMRRQRLVRARDDAQRPVVGGGIRYREPHRGSLNGVAYLEIEVVLVPVGGYVCGWAEEKLQVTRRFRVVALQSIGAIAVARDNSMSRTAFETSRAIRSILRT